MVATKGETQIKNGLNKSINLKINIYVTFILIFNKYELIIQTIYSLYIESIFCSNIKMVY